MNIYDECMTENEVREYEALAAKHEADIMYAANLINTLRSVNALREEIKGELLQVLDMLEKAGIEPLTPLMFTSRCADYFTPQ